MVYFCMNNFIFVDFSLFQFYTGLTVIAVLEVGDGSNLFVKGRHV